MSGYEKVLTADPEGAPELSRSNSGQGSTGGSSYSNHHAAPLWSFRHKNTKRNGFIAACLLLLSLPVLAIYASGTRPKSPYYTAVDGAKPLDMHELNAILADKHPLKKGDLAILMKTGASVLEQRLASHMDCEFNASDPSTQWPTFQVYSDWEQEFRGHKVVDAVAMVDYGHMLPHEADQHRKQKEELDSGVLPQDLDTGNTWALDKYKFIPMLKDAYERFPEAKYFVCMEADSWMFLGSLLRWLQSQNHHGQAFYGSPVEIIDQHWWFAHGGSGYVLSRGLMDATFGKDPNHMMHAFDAMLPHMCCGEEWLARSMYSLPNVQIKAPFGGSNQYFSGETPRSQRYDANNWCEPIMSFHHLKQADDIESLFRFERDFFPRLLPTDLIRHVDVYDHFAPDFLREAYDRGDAQVVQNIWENRCEDEVQPNEEAGEVLDQSFCEAACERRSDCLQWQFFNGMDITPHQGNRCQIYSKVRIGAGGNRHGFVSGWRLDRFRAMRESAWCDRRPLLS